jgi:hypothetical protein
MAIPIRSKLDSVYVPSTVDLRPDKDGKLPSVTLQALRTLLTSIATKINGLISFGQAKNGSWAGNLDAQFLNVTPKAVDAEFAVPHGLGRVPGGYIVVRSSSASVLYDSGGGNWTDTTLYLRSSAPAGTFQVLVF